MPRTTGILDIALAESLADIARKAGDAIMDVYGGGDFAVEYKDDRSPLTEADRRSHEIIVRSIEMLTPGVPVLSEEGDVIPFEKRRGWDPFYLVDPLDGTKEFIDRNGEFTVNIAIVEAGRPSLGVLYVPAQRLVYFASAGHGAFRRDADGSPVRISVSGVLPNDPLVAVASRSHGTEEVERFLGRFDIRERKSAGSALKFCMVAEGSADIYPRFGPTWEWDTAAGHAILLEAGGRLIRTDSRSELEYNKPVLKHEGFIAASAGFIEQIEIGG